MQFEWNGHTALRYEGGFVCPELLAATHRDVPAKLKEPIIQHRKNCCWQYVIKTEKVEQRKGPDQNRSCQRSRLEQNRAVKISG